MGRCWNRTAAGVVAVLLVSACGCESTRELLVDSDPQAAEVYVDGQLVGKTPYVGQIEYTGEDHRVIVQVVKPGFLPQRQVCRETDRQNDVFVNLRRAPGQ